MNPYAILIPLLLLGAALLDIVADWLNMRHASREPPCTLADIYDKDRYRTSQSYLREHTCQGIFESGLMVILTVGFILTGGLHLVDDWARSLNLGAIGTGLVFVATLGLITFLAGLPFAIRTTFSIEARFGFNHTTVATFILDRIKVVALALIIGGPILALVFWTFLFLGTTAWLFAWIALTCIQLFLLFITPVVIMPLFNKFIPLPAGDLRSAIEAYASANAVKIKDVYTMDGSKRSGKSNAFFAGFGRFRRIVLFDTLINNHSTDELLAVLAHETGHYKLGHLPWMLATSVAQSGLMLFLMSQFMFNRDLALAFQMNSPSVHAGLIGFGILYTPIGLLLGIVNNAVSRRHEYAADEFARRTTGTAEHLINALKKLSRDNLSNLTPHPLKVVLSYSHPPLKDRIAALIANR